MESTKFIYSVVIVKIFMSNNCYGYTLSQNQFNTMSWPNDKKLLDETWTNKWKRHLMKNITQFQRKHAIFVRYDIFKLLLDLSMFVEILCKWIEVLYGQYIFNSWPYLKASVRLCTWETGYWNNTVGSVCSWRIFQYFKP